MTKRITLPNGQFTLVDDEDFDFLNQWSWHLSTRGYVRRTFWHRVQKKGVPRKSTPLAMHRVVLKAPPGLEIDHISGDKLDNRKDNLRFCTRSQNMQNIAPDQSIGTSKYKGVYRKKNRNGKTAWCVQIRVNQRNIYLGRFSEERTAALAYDVAARKFHGVFAQVNFPTEQPDVGAIESSRSKRPLNLEQAKEIRHMRQEMNLTYVQLARHFGISIAQVGNVVLGHCWKEE